MNPNILFFFFAAFGFCISQVAAEKNIDNFVKVISFDGMHSYLNGDNAKASNCYAKVAGHYEDLIQLYICQMNTTPKKFDEIFTFNANPNTWAKTAVRELKEIADEVAKYQKKLREAFEGMQPEKVKGHTNDVHSVIQPKYDIYKKQMGYFTGKWTQSGKNVKGIIQGLSEPLDTKIKQLFLNFKTCMQSN